MSCYKNNLCIYNLHLLKVSAIALLEKGFDWFFFKEYIHMHTDTKRYKHTHSDIYTSLLTHTM